jgi:uncharacterized protein YjbI with pentapeptide repeats
MRAYEKKEKLIKVLKTNIKLWNRYQVIVGLELSLKIDLSYADLRYADLSSANLRSANLRYADLRYADLRSANLSSANLSYADLSYANLSYADLSYADLSSANLSSANLRSADLRYANLRYADLRSADLRYADLSSANLDYGIWNLSCDTLHIKNTDEKLRIQLCFHWMKLIENEESPTEEEKEIYSTVLNYANKFHRTDVEKLKPLKP